MSYFFQIPGIKRVLFLVMAAAAFEPSPSLSQEPAKNKKELGTFTLQFENDLFYGADRQYTNGLRLSWVSPKGDESFEQVEWIRDVLEKVSFRKNAETRFGFAAGQEIYTPEDRKRSDLIIDDRPYAGWLYGAMSLHSETKKPWYRELESIELNLGIVGPQAFGQETQDLIHNIRVIDLFEGWGNQLKNEPGVLLMYERKWRFFDPVPLGPLHFDIVPHAGASLGNVLTHVNVGGSVRYGYNIPKDFGPPSLIKGLTSMDTIPEAKLSLYVFAGTEGRYVARNIFLDGNTFADSHSVKKNRWVADFSVGVALIYRRFKISYTNALRTREFVGQKNNARFGSISASWQMFF